MPEPGVGRKAAVVFVFVTVLLDVLAVGIIIPVFPQLVLSFQGGNAVTAAQIFGVFGTIFALMQFFGAPVLGMLSDRFGRRRVILLSNFGLGVDYIIMALAPALWWLFVGRVVAGFTTASIPTAYAYISDVTPPEKRAGQFAMLGGAFGLGFIIGPATGGLLGAVDLRLPFWVAAGLSFANWLYGSFVLPESLAPEKRHHKFEWTRANPLGSLRLLRSNTVLLGLGGVLFLVFLAHESFNVFVLYANYRYAWDPRQMGAALAIVGVCSATVQILLVQRVVTRFGERSALIAGSLFGALGFAIFGTAPAGWILLLGMPFISLWGFTTPSAQALMTKRVTPGEQGQLQGAIGSVRGIAMLIGPTLFSQIFATFIGGWKSLGVSGAPYLLASTCLVSAAALGLYVMRGFPAHVRPAAVAESGIPPELFPLEEAP